MPTFNAVTAQKDVREPRIACLRLNRPDSGRQIPEGDQARALAAELERQLKQARARL